MRLASLVANIAHRSVWRGLTRDWNVTMQVTRSPNPGGQGVDKVAQNLNGIGKMFTSVSVEGTMLRADITPSFLSSILSAQDGWEKSGDISWGERKACEAINSLSCAVTIAYELEKESVVIKAGSKAGFDPPKIEGNGVGGLRRFGSDAGAERETIVGVGDAKVVLKPRDLAWKKVPCNDGAVFVRGTNGRYEVRSRVFLRNETRKVIKLVCETASGSVDVGGLEAGGMKR